MYNVCEVVLHVHSLVWCYMYNVRGVVRSYRMWRGVVLHMYVVWCYLYMMWCYMYIVWCGVTCTMYVVWCGEILPYVVWCGVACTWCGVICMW